MRREWFLDRMSSIAPMALGLATVLAAGFLLVEPALREAEKADADSDRFLAQIAAGERATVALPGLRRQQEALRAELAMAGRLPAHDIHRIDGCGEFAEFWDALARFESGGIVRHLEIVRDPAGDEVRFEADVDRLISVGGEEDR